MLSPLLFVMVSKVLNKMIRRVKGRFIRGFEVGSRGVSIFHLQFVDDTMIFCEANVEHLGYLRCIFRCFEVVSGLNINLAKSENFQIGEVADIDNLDWILCCKVGALLLISYCLWENYKSKVIWDPVIKRISMCLDSW